MEMETYIGIIISLLGGLFGAYVIVKVSIAEIKKDITFLREKLDIQSRERHLNDQKEEAIINEVRDDVKAIFRTLTKMQIEQAKTVGQENILEGIKDAIKEIKKMP